MKRKRSLPALLALFVVVFALWTLSYGTKTSSTPAAAASGEFSQAPYTPSQPVEIHHKVVQKVHTYQGALSITTPCGTLGAGVSSTGSGTPHVSLALRVMQERGCTQQPGLVSEPFAVSLVQEGSAAPVFDGLTINGASVAYTLIDDQ